MTRVLVNPEVGFQPAFDFPRTAAEALAVLETQGDPTCYTHSAGKMRRCHELILGLLCGMLEILNTCPEMAAVPEGRALRQLLRETLT